MRRSSGPFLDTGSGGLRAAGHVPFDRPFSPWSPFSVPLRISLPAAGGRPSSTPAPGAPPGRILEIMPPISEVPAQVVIYVDEEPRVIECIAQIEEDGSTTISVPIDTGVPPGTPIQIIIYDDPENPRVVEGSTLDDGTDGILDIGLIEIPETLLD